MLKVFLASIIVFLGIYPFAYIRKNVVTENEIYGIFLGNYIYYSHYFLLISFVLLLVHYFIRPISIKLRVWIYAISLSLIGVIGYYNYRYSDLVYTTITLNKPAQREQLRIAFISDLHLSATSNKTMFEEMVEKVNNAKPDIIIFGGDILENTYTNLKDDYQTVFAKLTAKDGIYTILGNHEYYGDNLAQNIQYIESLGIQVLQDQVLNIDGIQFVARDDIGNKFVVTKRASLDSLFKQYHISTDEPIIVLDHNPKNIAESVKNQADIQLSGHTHAGQFFPYNLALMAVYPNGLGYKKIGNLHTIVSAGVGVGSWKIVGSWQMPYRFGTDSEINIIDITFAKLAQEKDTLAP